MENEIWKDVPGYEGYYQVSSIGRVKGLARYVPHSRSKNGKQFVKEKILRQRIKSTGYLIIGLTTNNKPKIFQVHQLVAMAFLNHTPCGFKLVVNHINFNITDNRVENLEIVTNRENSNQKHLPSSSKYVGVCWSKANQNWTAMIKIKKQSTYLGSFDNEEEATLYYQNAVKAIENGEEIVVKGRNSSSKYKGVTWNKINKKWLARAYLNKKEVYLGYFKNEYDAHLAVVKANSDFTKTKKATTN